MARLLFFTFLLFSIGISAQSKFELLDVFDLEYASDPQFSPDGKSIVYVRNSKDIMRDANRSNLWKIDIASKMHVPITSGQYNLWNPTFSPDGKKLAYISNEDGHNQIKIRWMSTGQVATMSNLTQSPSGLSWSPDGKWIAFSMAVPFDQQSIGQMPKKPKGAKWADPPIYIDALKYRADGAGYLKSTHRQLFVLSADGGTPRQLTFDPYDHGRNLSWHPNGQQLFYSANGHDNHDYEPNNSELYQLDIASGAIKTLTTRFGPDQNPKVSSDGKYIAYTGLDDKFLGYQTPSVYLYDLSANTSKCLTCSFDRQVGNIQWHPSKSEIYFQYDEEGSMHVGSVDMSGKVTTHLKDGGGMSLGRPYVAGTYQVGQNGQIAYTMSRTDRPADIGLSQNGRTTQLTFLNEDVLAHKKLGKTEEVWWSSTFDDQKIQGWVVTPPDFDPNKKYPLLLEIHGGPFAAYGPHFTAEVQAYAAADYVVLYCNPRGSSSYGHDFGNLIHHNYPGNDYDDLMAGVDAVIEKGYIDQNELYVTGGSGGGVLTSWIIGKTDRFKAAVVAKPVINWYSFVLHADNPAYFYKYWFPGPPWEHESHYMKRSPISLVGNVKTPTMLLTGEQDFRTPISESEQYYAALKLNKVEASMVRIPGAGHGIANKPSQLIAKIESIVSWFEKYRSPNKS